MTKPEYQFGNILQQIATGLYDIVNSVVVNYSTGDVTISIAGVPTAKLQAAQARIAAMIADGVNIAASINNSAHTATVHAPGLATLASNLTAQNATNIEGWLVDDLGYTVAIDTAAKTVTLGWANGD